MRTQNEQLKEGCHGHAVPRGDQHDELQFSRQRAGRFATARSCRSTQNQALFSLLGTTYGGNGTTTFRLPNLQSGADPLWPRAGLSNYTQGQAGGTETVTLTTTTIPAHSHTVQRHDGQCQRSRDRQHSAAGRPDGRERGFLRGAGHRRRSKLQNLAATSVSTAGGSQPHNNLMPSLCINFIIALAGHFPVAELR